MSLRIAMAAVFVAATVSIAGAVTLDSAVMGNLSPRTAVCRVVNVGTKPITVTARLLNTTSGTNIASSTTPQCAGTLPLLPHNTCFASLSGSIFIRCNITSSSSRIRATLTSESGGLAEITLPVTTK